jgi:hypothetical protein
MPVVPLKLVPTVNVEFTETLNEAGISACNLIRFKAKLPQKLGGWDKFYPFSVPGIPRDLHPWQDLNAIGHLGVGTTTMLGVITNGALLDITPQTFLSDFTPDFTTTSGSATVEITDPNIMNVTTFDSVFFNTPISVGGIILAGLYQITNVTGATSYEIEASELATATVSNGGDVPVFDTTSGAALVQVTLADHGLAQGEVAVFPIPTTVGGLTIGGSYNVVQVGSPSQFSITAASVATSTATASMNGGDAQLLYYINLGPAAAGVGYGLGGYGLGGYGTGVVPAVQTGTPITATSYTLDNWGEILLACPQGGGIYYWSPTGGFANASLVSSGPVFNGGLFVAMPQQILVTWGSTVTEGIGVRQDPLLVRWSDSQNFLEWSVTAITQAGSFRIPTGSKIVGGLQGPQQALIWTDIDVYAMSPGNFFAMSGSGIQEIPCTVWDVVFQDLDAANQHKCVAAPNSTFDEVTFYYPSLSGGSGENDSYVKFNTEEQSWDYGTLPRSAWTDQSVLGEPIGSTPAGIIFQHETSPDADGQVLNAWFETGWFVIAEGQEFAFLDWFFPDMKFGLFNGAQDATVLVTITAASYPNGTQTVFGPYSMTSAQTFVNTRLRGRQIKLRFESNDIGSFWRLGLMRYRVARDGRR